ncbi:MAG: WYL domain-containing protein [Myxococcota bacterium]|nr:WYL domain-containing protein [Myxococcota bacterium]
MPKHVALEAKVVRCLVLTFAMARARRGLQVTPFYKRRGWNWRSAYRDLQALLAAEVPVEQREHGWWGLDHGWMPVGAVDLKDDERWALALARQLAPGLKETSLGKALDGVWAKLASQPQIDLPLDDGFGTRAAPTIDYGPHRVALDALRDAIARRAPVSIRYRTGEGDTSERVIEPVLLHWEQSLETLYVIAWCRMREALRTFAVHRASAVTIVEGSFAPRREALVELSQAYRVWLRPHPERVSIKFSPRVASEIRERWWHGTQRFTDGADGSVVLELEVGAAEELERLVMGFGPDAEVLLPLRLAERVQAGHAAALRPQHAGLLRARRDVAQTMTRQRVKLSRP